MVAAEQISALQAAPRQPAAGGTPEVSRQASTEAPAPATAPALRLRRQSNGVEVVIEGVGAGPQLQQGSSGAGWEGMITLTRPLQRASSPVLALPEAGIEAVSLEGSGTSFRVQVRPMRGFPLGRPLVSADGNSLILGFAASPQASLQTSRFDITTPGRVPQPATAPPLQPRAVAPPVGDMAVGSMTLRNPGFVNVRGPRVTLTLNNAPAKDALMSLARIGGYGFVFVGQAKASDGGNDPNSSTTANSSDSVAAAMNPVSVAFNNEPFANALNTVLLASGLQGKLEGNIIFAGQNVVGKGFGPRLSKVYRLNQVGADNAADYLANLGAVVSKTNTVTTSVTQGNSQSQAIAGGANSATTTSSSITKVESYGASSGPLVGLQATTDNRLGTITLIGEPATVAVAEQYLRQLDLRQRQVALSVKILDVNLDSDTDISNSFAFRYGNNFIINENGQLSGVFNSLLPPNADQFAAMATNNEELNKKNPNKPPINPGQFYPKDNFYDFVRAKIQSTSTKVLASPTLILSENPGNIEGGNEASGAGSQSAFAKSTIGRLRANESFVTVGTEVVTDYDVISGTQGAPNVCKPKFGTAGLTFGARVSKIDDNGFITFAMSPTVAAITGSQSVGNCGLLSILSLRRLDTGLVRVRDGQTLILTGVISDADSQAVTKWPILGDIPFIGQFFRSSSGGRKKNELVIMVTPRIINDDQGGTYGYGYAPASMDSRQLMNSASP